MQVETVFDYRLAFNPCRLECFELDLAVIYPLRLQMKRKFLVSILLLLLTFFIGVWITGTVLTAPVRQSAGAAPSDLAATAIEFQSNSGATIKGWLIKGEKDAGAIILMHGVRASRLSMVDRARFLSRAGFTVLLFDFQAHGESSGDHITFGYLESKDAQAAIEFLRANAPGERIGVIGVSMGGAAMLLAEQPLEVNAMVLEMVYPTIDEAIGNRLSMRFGGWSRILTPLLTWQLKPRLGVNTDALQPLNRLGKITAPTLFVVGAEDQHTTLEESRQMFNAAAEPKELWIIERAAHVDLHAAQKEEYERRVLSFFTSRLASSALVRANV
jgi:pimeloyl-ACP methyl ester carboxylesterase